MLTPGWSGGEIWHRLRRCCSSKPPTTVKHAHFVLKSARGSEESAKQCGPPLGPPSGLGYLSAPQAKVAQANHVGRVLCGAFQGGIPFVTAVSVVVLYGRYSMDLPICPYTAEVHLRFGLKLAGPADYPVQGFEGLCRLENHPPHAGS